MTILACAGLSLAFGGVRAVADVSLGVERGELVGLIGPNGAGKTTLLRLCAGSLIPDSGAVWYDAREVTRMPLHRRARLGRVLTHQIVRPFAKMTLAENVMVAAGARTTRHPWRALALEPQLLMLDEPLAGLNSTEATRLADELAGLNARGLTIVLVEHNLGAVTRIARRLAVLQNGALLADGPPHEVLARSDVRDAYLGTGQGGTVGHA